MTFARYFEDHNSPKSLNIFLRRGRVEGVGRGKGGGVLVGFFSE